MLYTLFLSSFKALVFVSGISLWYKKDMAIFTQIDDATLRTFLQNYDLGNILKIEGIEAGSENTNYKIDTIDSAYVLTIFESRVNPADLPHIIEAVMTLEDAALPVPHLVKCKQGKVLKQIEGKICLLQTFLKGDHTAFPTVEQSLNGGRLLAAMHYATEDLTFPVKNRMGTADLHRLLEEIKTASKTVELTEIFKTAQEELSFLEHNPPSGLRKSMIHGDFFKDNVMMDGDDIIGVIDFWFACRENSIYDLALAINVWAFHEGEFLPEQCHAMIKGYNDNHPLTEAEKEALPLELRRAALRIMITRLYDTLTGKSVDIMRSKPVETWLGRLEFHQQKGIHIS